MPDLIRYPPFPSETRILNQVQDDVFYMNNHYGGVIWTNHALDRLKERGISQGDALAAFNRPDQSRPGSSDKGSTVYYKTFGNDRIEVVAKKNEKGEWLILSVWSRPVYGNQKHYSTSPLLFRFFKWLFG